MAKKNFLDINGNIIEDVLCVEEDSHGLMCPEDKVKLASIEDGANKYIHPNTHEASMITQDTTHRFVTDSQISNWANTSYVNEQDTATLTEAKSYTDTQTANFITQSDMETYIEEQLLGGKW